MKVVYAVSSLIWWQSFQCGRGNRWSHTV